MIPKPIAEYLSELNTLEVQRITQQGRTLVILTVDMAAWEAWIDPDSQVQDFDRYFKLTDYVPSDGMVYALDEERPVRWGSGWDAAGAVAEALHSGR